jgi:hypothetical protein
MLAPSNKRNEMWATASILSLLGMAESEGVLSITLGSDLQAGRPQTLKGGVRGQKLPAMPDTTARWSGRRCSRKVLTSGSMIRL